MSNELTILRDRIARLEEQQRASFASLREELGKWCRRACEAEDREREKDREIEWLKFELSRRAA